MIGDFTAYYLNQDELKNILEINKRFQASYSPYILITISHFYNEETFEGTISFADLNSVPQLITTKNDRSNSIMVEYYEQRAGVFTFDGVRYFKILNSAVKKDKEGVIIFTFRYTTRPSFSERNTAFMIMPFRFPELSNFYKKNVKDFLIGSELKIKVSRSDDFTGTDVVADTILEEIQKAEFILCDITNCNKNVFFELGYAKGINKSIIFLLEQNKPAEFFDVNHIRRIEYSYQQEVQFQNLLKDTLISVRNTSL